MVNNKNKFPSLFVTIERAFSVIPWILLAIALYFLFRVNNSTLYDLSMSYVAGMVVYVLTVVLPDVMKNVKLRRYVINDLAILYKDYKDLLRTISDRSPNEDPYSISQVRKGLERYNCRRQSSCICLSNRTIDIIKPKCERILNDTSKLMSKANALSVDELLVIHEITQIWFLRDIISLEDGKDYYQSRKEMVIKVEYLLQRYNDLQSVYFKIKRLSNLTTGRHPAKRNNN